jgi:hypothetical protein
MRADRDPPQASSLLLMPKSAVDCGWFRMAGGRDGAMPDLDSHGGGRAERDGELRRHRFRESEPEAAGQHVGEQVVPSGKPALPVLKDLVHSVLYSGDGNGDLGVEGTGGWLRKPPPLSAATSDSATRKCAGKDSNRAWCSCIWTSP